MTSAAPAGGALQTPSLLRRLACFVYEGVLLFGVVMGAGLVWSMATDQRHALVGMHGLQLFVFFVLGVYFVWFWSNRGQTLAMQTWHIRLLTTEGQPVTRTRAVCRFVLSWLWFLPALTGLWLTGPRGSGTVAAALFVGVLVYAGLTRLHPTRQYWHDAACGTRLVEWRPASKRET